MPAPRPECGAQAPARAPHHAGHCERLTYEGGGCTCHALDDYDLEPANMADLEDGIGAWW
ncbi:hypothetical protein [Streptomyces sp. NPDC059957]|uniref:hypothetical protein n=1 Tax=unclassified Streptomyces TaxID=2593676 RepID=UPI00365A693F